MSMWKELLKMAIELKQKEETHEECEEHECDKFDDIFDKLLDDKNNELEK